MIFTKNCQDSEKLFKKYLNMKLRLNPPSYFKKKIFNQFNSLCLTIISAFKIIMLQKQLLLQTPKKYYFRNASHSRMIFYKESLIVPPNGWKKSA